MESSFASSVQQNPNQHLEGNQNRPKAQKITSLFVQPIFHFHDYGRKGKDAFCSSKEGRPLVKVDLLFDTTFYLAIGADFKEHAFFFV